MKSSFSGKTGITTSKNPSINSLILVQEFSQLFPRVQYFKRKDFKIRQIAHFLKIRNYQNLLVLEEKKIVRKELWQINLKKNLTLQFEISSILLRKNLGIKGVPTFHEPELILNNFTGRIGNIAANLIKDLFSEKPNFKGRQVITFHFEKNFIFVRFHRYIFSSSGDDVNIQELGPRLTLRLLNLHLNFFKTA